ncbi:leucyl aminopeptidase family protein [uncultured Roseibium sp.]|uniref:leucyl aminopeptidase family protein n=1 Tax=uncultured Roseibium sp. TaxID=1936171 RepID=UPI003217EFDF
MREALIREIEAQQPTPVIAVGEDDLEAVLAGLGQPAADWAKRNGFRAAAGSNLLVPAVNEAGSALLFAAGENGSAQPFALGGLVSTLPAGGYALADGFPDPEFAVLGFALSSYRFEKYRKNGAARARLVVPATVDVARVDAILKGVQIARDLINIPANDMGPQELAAEIRSLFVENGGTGEIIEGDALLDRGFPMVHAVGRASSREPRLADFTWGPEDAPKVTLVGKGVIFDTGGLDIKPSSAMLLMKKDMGGAANVLGLAAMIMASELPVRLRVIVPCVENAISGSAFRPGDVLSSRKGLSVEIGNTDAEGRLVLADALALADEEEPDLLVDMATLTGAARVALGPDLPPFFTDDEDLAEELALMAEASADPLWRLPLWQPYMKYLDSKIADINHINTTGAGFAGSITAALFLSRFVEKAQSWVHFDIYGWTPAEKPGKPAGGEAQGIRCLFDLISERYSGEK